MSGSIWRQQNQIWPKDPCGFVCGSPFYVAVSENLEILTYACTSSLHQECQSSWIFWECLICCSWIDLTTVLTLLVWKHACVAHKALFLFYASLAYLLLLNLKAVSVWAKPIWVRLSVYPINLVLWNFINNSPVVGYHCLRLPQQVQGRTKQVLKHMIPVNL